MGGQHGYFGLWLDCDFGHGHSRARPRCTTYGSPQLSGDEDFKLDTVEVWAVGQLPEEQEQVCDRNVTIVNFEFLECAFWFKKCLCWHLGWEEEEHIRCRSWSTGHNGNDREDPAQPRSPRTWRGRGTVRKEKRRHLQYFISVFGLVWFMLLHYCRYRGNHTAANHLLRSLYSAVFMLICKIQELVSCFLWNIIMCIQRHSVKYC